MGKCVCVDSVHHDDDVVTLSMADHLTAAQDSNQIRIHSVTSPGDFSLLTKDKIKKNCSHFFFVFL